MDNTAYIEIISQAPINIRVEKKIKGRAAYKKLNDDITVRVPSSIKAISLCDRSLKVQKATLYSKEPETLTIVSNKWSEGSICKDNQINTIINIFFFFIELIM